MQQQKHTTQESTQFALTHMMGEGFCDKLGKRIERIRYNGEISSDRMADILKRHVEFLYEQKVLNETEAKSALERISNKSNISIVNFAKN